MECVLNISAHKYGNYHKYYEFHPATARTSLLDKDQMFYTMWKAQGEPNKFVLLDIGCNEGDLSVDVLNIVRKELPDNVECILLGIDIDSSLIELANSKYCNEGNKNNTNNTHISFEAFSFMDSTTTDDYFKKYFKQHNITGFNFISMFSITMWIHLNHNDIGLLNFIDQGVKYLTTQGSILIEPQPWKCYKNANKRCRKLGLTKPLYLDQIKLKDIDKEIISYLLPVTTTSDNGSSSSVTSVGFRTTSSSNSIHNSIKSYWCLGKEIWGRSLLIFHKSDVILPLPSSLLPVSNSVKELIEVVTADVGVKSDEVDDEHLDKRSKQDSIVDSSV